MLRLGPIATADGDPDAEPTQQRNRHESGSEPLQREGPEQPAPARRPDQPARGQQPSPSCPAETAASLPVSYGVEVRVSLSTLLELDEHPAELPGWGPIPAAAARNLVAVQHNAEWRIAIVDAQGYLLHGEVKCFSYTTI
jgi:hypothetical protein